MYPARNSFLISALLHLLAPGLGHIFLREYLFGAFIFLIMLLAAALYYLSLVVTLPIALLWTLMALPLLFYLFTFLDLYRTSKRVGRATGRSTRAGLTFLVIALSYQIFSPSAPICFALDNLPQIYRIRDDGLNPLLHRDDLVIADRLAYSAKVFFYDLPLLYDLPLAGDVIRFRDERGKLRTGLTLGQPGEEIGVVDGTLYVNGFDGSNMLPPSLGLRGDMPLTLTDDRSIMVVTLYFGEVAEIHQVPLENIVGRVSSLF